MQNTEAFSSPVPELASAMVWVHYSSHEPLFNRADCWGPLHIAADKKPPSSQSLLRRDRIDVALSTGVSTHLDSLVFQTTGETAARLRGMSAVMLFVALLWCAAALNTSVALACFMFL